MVWLWKHHIKTNRVKKEPNKKQEIGSYENKYKRTQNRMLFAQIQNEQPRKGSCIRCENPLATIKIVRVFLVRHSQFKYTE